MNIFYHSLHMELWDWLAANPTKKKKDWPRWVSNGGDIELVHSFCFACEYGSSSDCRFIHCRVKCPFYISKNTDFCLNGLYNEWSENDPINFLEDKNKEEAIRKRIAAAEKIRDLSVKPEIICK